LDHIDSLFAFDIALHDDAAETASAAFGFIDHSQYP
jgi:hypothetical protein